jgi:ribosomal protein S12 methylthiotransferase accessory factor
LQDGWRGPPYLEAAEALAGDRNPGPEAAQFLDLLGYAGEQFSPAETGNRIGLLRFAARMNTLLPYRGPDAPGLLFFLGMFDAGAFADWSAEDAVVSTIGADPRPGRAFEAAVGEAIEYASQLQRGDEPLHRAAGMPGAFSQAERSALAAMLSLGDTETLLALDWLPARRLGDGAESALPADLCLRRPPCASVAQSAAPLSIGCAAGPTLDEAVLGGLLELVERDAAALWWRGGDKAAALALDGEAARQTTELLHEIRRGADRRATWLLDITSGIGIPCVAALSVDRDGRQISCGLSAGLSPAQAARSAIREMGQYELAYHLIEVKRRANPGHELNPQEREQMQRGAEILPDDQPLLHPALAPRRHAGNDGMDPAEAIAWVASHLEAAGFQAHAVDLTRAEFGIPVAKVVVPGLQLDPSGMVTPRLLDRLRANGLPDQTLSRLPLH